MQNVENLKPKGKDQIRKEAKKNGRKICKIVINEECDEMAGLEQINSVEIFVTSNKQKSKKTLLANNIFNNTKII